MQPKPVPLCTNTPPDALALRRSTMTWGDFEQSHCSRRICPSPGDRDFFQGESVYSTILTPTAPRRG